MERQAVYKFQANAEFRRAQRTKTINEKRKEKRCTVMMSNRRFPLEEKNEITEAAPLADKGSYKLNLKCLSEPLVSF